MYKLKMPRKLVYYRQSALTRMSPLISCSRDGASEEVESLLSQGADVNHQGEYDISALHLASLHGHSYIVELLLQHGASPNLLDAWG